ncbi:peptidoglycan recognition family protein [Parafrankia sp. EUN1f]|uniref:peptidoglycan recognition protein family protein n=1 Tax=Parafrankia sp. EUN1f TaxID=102897 RepID=UPI0001C46BF5|nr:peptidoglycan recognition family protein [Parafrankia sp. EUN1f]EFC80880.1 N-acetylmuramyl-L-alanine amidase, negative regulator of AmpC, AmpD [Parafrankia sp. EUN1f]
MSYPTRYPGAVWRPVRNYTAGGIVVPTRGLIVHVQQGNGSLFGWFDNAASQVSAHLWVSKTGAVEEYVLLTDRAWAQAAGNRFWISVECEGFTTEDYTPQQLGRLAEIYRWGMAEFGWPAQITDDPNGYGLGTHRMGGASWGGHACPGDLRAGRRTDILAAARGYPTSPPPSEEDDMQLSDEDVARISARLRADLFAEVLTAAGEKTPIRQGSAGMTLGSVYLKAGDLQSRVYALETEVARVGSYLSTDGALVAWTRAIGTDLAAVRADVARLTAGDGGAVDLTAVLARLDALSARLSSLTLTVAPGGTTL